MAWLGGWPSSGNTPARSQWKSAFCCMRESPHVHGGRSPLRFILGPVQAFCRSNLVFSVEVARPNPRLRQSFARLLLEAYVQATAVGSFPPWVSAMPKEGDWRRPLCQLFGELHSVLSGGFISLVWAALSSFGAGWKCKFVLGIISIAGNAAMGIGNGSLWYLSQPLCVRGAQSCSMAL